MPDGFEAGSSLDGYSSEGPARGKICYQELKSRGEGQGAGYLKIHKIAWKNLPSYFGFFFHAILRFGLSIGAVLLLQDPKVGVAAHRRTPSR